MLAPGRGLDANGKLAAQPRARFVVSRFNNPIGTAADNLPGDASENIAGPATGN